MREKIIGLLFATLGVGAIGFMVRVEQTSTNSKEIGKRPYIGVIIYIVACIFGPKYLQERLTANSDKLIKKIPFISLKSDEDGDK